MNKWSRQLETDEIVCVAVLSPQLATMSKCGLKDPTQPELSKEVEKSDWMWDIERFNTSPNANFWKKNNT